MAVQCCYLHIRIVTVKGATTLYTYTCKNTYLLLYSSPNLVLNVSSSLLAEPTSRPGQAVHVEYMYTNSKIVHGKF